MIRYRHLYEGDNPDLGDYIYPSPDIQLYDIVRCAGFNWYVIDIKGDIVTLLAKNDDFGKSMFDKESNGYKYSKIRNYISREVYPELRTANPIPTRLNDVDCTDRVWLLSIDEAEKLPRDILKFNNWWWLRSRGRYDSQVADVSEYGSASDYGGNIKDDSNSIRPAMRVRIEDLG